MELQLAQAVYSKPQATNRDEVKAAWDNGKDFLIKNGPDAGRYCSSRDANELSISGVTKLILSKTDGSCIYTIDPIV